MGGTCHCFEGGRLSGDFPARTAEEVIGDLSARFRELGRDRRLYAVLGQHAQITSFGRRLSALCAAGSLGDGSPEGTVAYWNLNEALIGHLRERDLWQRASEFAERRQCQALAKLMGQEWHEWLSGQMMLHRGLVLSGFELLFAYLDANALALVRQYAINGKHICLLLPGQIRERQVLAFAETQEYERLITGLVPEWAYLLKEENLA